MKEVYTAFTKSNVLAIRAGRKWQTRRVIKPQPVPSKMGDGLWVVKTARGIKAMSLINATKQDVEYWTMKWCPWQLGDILCVKEGYQIDGISGEDIHGRYLADNVRFDVHLTDDEWERWVARKYPYRATSARFMYRSLCRIKRPVIWSRVEPVQDISLENAIAEGLIYVNPGYRYDPVGRVFSTPRLAFAALWDSINPKALFDSNVWVWATEFERREI